jgi:hypothetical protein
VLEVQPVQFFQIAWQRVRQAYGAHAPANQRYRRSLLQLKHFQARFAGLGAVGYIVQPEAWLRSTSIPTTNGALAFWRWSLVRIGK